MALSEVLDRLRSLHDVELSLAHQPPVLRLPTPEEVEKAQAELGAQFHPDYRRFLLEAGDVAFGTLAPSVVTPGAGHRDLVETATTAWEMVDLPLNLLPICEDNADYFCMMRSGQSSQVLYWSHDGDTDESWPDLASWITQVWLRKR